MIGGNIEVMLQQMTGSESNGIGEKISVWTDYQSMLGWLDYSGGDAKYTYDAKLQESTHIFITDYITIDRNPNNKRLVVNGSVYEVLMIDDPMELHQQLEFTLKFVG